ncbi:MAG: signal peptidase II [Lachnospiraceae bacterium]|nr:signal peptidase II [Lachnospiraceae bacterium]
MQYIITLLIVFAGEFFWKDHIEKEVSENSSKKIWHDRIILTKYHNYGAALGTGKKRPKIVKYISVVITFVAVIFFICSFGLAGKGMMKSGFSLLLGGAFSNTYDRLKRGYVVDYFRLNVPVKRIRNIIFNVSDFCIILGTLLILLSDGME